MAGQAAKHKVNIGLTSLILIFIILCLATFSLLSLSSARYHVTGRNKNSGRECSLRTWL